MKQYIEISVACQSEDMSDILTAYLADFPFESFDTETTAEGLVLKAYILAEGWSECREEALAVAEEYGKLLGETVIEDENWNAEWESTGFERVEIEDVMVIRAPHHAPAKEGVIDIVVAPQMSFGSGHHQTTRLMCRLIHALKPTGRVLDVGCGTGVLSLVALRCGAESADAIDIDIWSVESAKESARLNDLAERIEVIHGTVESIAGRRYSLVVANINRNIILADIAQYVDALEQGGVLLLSGFLAGDVEDITSVATAMGLTPAECLCEDEWRALKFVKGGSIN
ncbi:MAG: 50S ribosomal protein L11 methyltransferase [Alistipes sp.]|nr:50S ribosomal protein L11 methyltransferase [Alistipes sp.]